MVDSAYILKVKPTEFASKFDVGCGKAWMIQSDVKNFRPSNACKVPNTQ